MKSIKWKIRPRNNRNGKSLFLPQVMEHVINDCITTARVSGRRLIVWIR